MTKEEFYQRYSFKPTDDYVGGGTFGTVYKAYDTTRGRDVAIKISEVKPGRASLKDELNAAGKVPEHINIAYYEAVYRFELENGLYDHAIMHFYPEGSLKQALEKGEISHDNRERLAMGILAGLKHIHDHDVIHRDIKSSNILVQKRGKQWIPNIADFGLSKWANTNEEGWVENSSSAGTIEYSAPEQILGQREIKLNADIWSLGVILYELFAGELPFFPSTLDKSDASIRQEISSKIVNAKIPEKILSIPQPYQDVIKKCLIVDVNKRAQSVNQLLSMIGGETILSESKERKEFKENNTSKPSFINIIKSPMGIGLISFIVVVGLVIAYSQTTSTPADIVINRDEVIIDAENGNRKTREEFSFEKTINELNGIEGQNERFEFYQNKKEIITELIAKEYTIFYKKQNYTVHGLMMKLIQSDDVVKIVKIQREEDNKINLLILK